MVICLFAPTVKMMFEVCTSLVLDMTNLFLLPFLHATGLALVNIGEKTITKKRVAILMKETQKKDVIIIINTRTRK